MSPGNDERRPGRGGAGVVWGLDDSSIVTLSGVNRRDGALLLDWSDAGHWSSRPRRCRGCGGLTNLLDDRQRPMHKVCAEAVGR